MATSNTAVATQQATQQATGIDFFNTEVFELTQRVCKTFASSTIVPASFQIASQGESKAVANCMIALEIAQRLGASPLMVMQNLTIVYGQPSWSAKFLIATVNTCGRFTPIKYEMGVDGKLSTGEDNLTCIAYSTDKASGEVLKSSPVSLKLAVDEGWYNKNGSKWKTMPKQMLMYRAASFWTRTYAPELSLGMQTIEEVEDFTEVEDLNRRVKSEKKFTSYEEVHEEDTPLAEVVENLKNLHTDDEVTAYAKSVKCSDRGFFEAVRHRKNEIAQELNAHAEEVMADWGATSEEGAKPANHYDA